MNLPDGLIAAPAALMTWFVALVAVACAVYTARWRMLAAVDGLHVFAGATVACMLLWTIAGNVGPGLSFHLLGTTIVTLMFGARLAVVVAALATVAITLAGLAGWQAFGLNVLLMGVVPVAVSRLFLVAVERGLPSHFFVYVLVGAFLNGGVAMAVNGIATVSVLALAGTREPAWLFGEYLPYCLLLGWGEALLTGMVVTIFVVYRPGWVRTFDDDRYLAGR